MNPILKGFFFIYQSLISPLIHLLTGPGVGCRYLPTCSDYSKEAFHRHGFIKGFALSFRRVSKCHPWGAHGYDPVPPPKEPK
jgi:putative membrane protein insertion efficiency factor